VGFRRSGLSEAATLSPLRMRAVRVGLVALALAGCGPVRTATGPCDLRVFADAHQQIEELALPYAIELGIDPVSVTFGGSGWKRVDIVAFRPDGNVFLHRVCKSSTTGWTGSRFPLPEGLLRARYVV